MNHLEEAKRIAERTMDRADRDQAKTLALIAIAEQLERMNNQRLRIEQSDIYKYIVKEDN